MARQAYPIRLCECYLGRWCENSRYDYPTDIITFPLEDEVLDGELYISLDTAARQAKEYGVSLTNELMRLVAHGTLHLVGYDDATDQQRKEMSRLEDNYIQLSLLRQWF